MTRISNPSLRLRLIQLVLIAILPALGLILYTAYEQRRIAKLDAQSDALRLARLVSTNQERLIESTRQLLSTLAQLSEVRRLNSQVCSTLFAGLLKEQPLYANLAAAIPDGNVFCSALPTAEPINITDRPYFQQALKSRDFAIGQYQIGRITRKASLNFGYPVIGDDGVMSAVVIAALDLIWLNRIVAKVHLPENSTLTVFDQNGAILVRYPEPEKWVGRPVPEASVLHSVLAQGEGTAEASGMDGKPRLYGFTPLLSGPHNGQVYVSVGVPKDVAFADADRILSRNLAGLTLVGILAFIAAWFGGDRFILRQISALVSATERLSKGDLSTRTGLPHRHDELGRLAYSFDKMAESLQEGRNEVQKANEQIQHNLERVRALREIDLAITSSLDLRSVLNVLLEKIDLFLPYAAATVRLLNRKSGQLEPVACWNLDEGEWKAETGGAGGLDRVLPEKNAPVMVRNALTDPRSLSSEFLRKHGLVSFLRVPLIAKDEVLGVLTFLTREEHEFSKDEVEFLTTLAGQAAIAIDNAQLYEQIKHQAVELETANKAKDEFLSIMSHELRTPLNVVSGYSALLKEGVLGDINPEQKRALKKIIAQAQNQLAMVNSMLQTAQIEAGAARIESEEVNLGDFYGELRSTYDVVDLGKELTLKWDFPPELPVIKTDRGKLRHILQNLINNAVKFTHKGTVAVSARHIPEVKTVEFKIADTGIGISKDKIPFIFEIFRQVDSSETRLYGGVGLGLYIVKKFIELLGGKVNVESELDKGSTFTVTIPSEFQSSEESRRDGHALASSQIHLTSLAETSRSEAVTARKDDQ